MKETRDILEKLQKVFVYAPETGEIYRNGKSVGSKQKSGYGLTYNYIRYEFHRVCFALYYGRWPEAGKVIDHINRDPYDNRLCNLREVTKSVNGRNTKRYRNNVNKGIAGITFDKSCGFYRVRCGKKYIGISRDFFEACCMRKSFENSSGNFTDTHFK